MQSPKCLRGTKREKEKWDEKEDADDDDDDDDDKDEEKVHQTEIPLDVHGIIKKKERKKMKEKWYKVINSKEYGSDGGVVVREYASLKAERCNFAIGGRHV